MFCEVRDFIDRITCSMMSIALFIDVSFLSLIVQVVASVFKSYNGVWFQGFECYVFLRLLSDGLHIHELQ